MEWYVRNLIKELGGLDDRHEWVVVTSPANWDLLNVPSRCWTKIAYVGEDNTPLSFLARKPDRPPGPRVLVRRALASLRSPRMRRWYGNLNDLIRQQNLDLWFCPLMYALPLEVEVPVVNTIPDLQHEHFPELDRKSVV